MLDGPPPPARALTAPTRGALATTLEPVQLAGERLGVRKRLHCVRKRIAELDRGAQLDQQRTLGLPAHGIKAQGRRLQATVRRARGLPGRALAGA